MGVLLEKYPVSDDNPSATKEEFEQAYSTFSSLTKPAFLEGCQSKKLCSFDLFGLESKSLTWFCGCSEERIDTMLCSIGREELASMIEELGVIEVVCEFCSTKYTRDKAAVDVLIEKISYI